MSRFDLAHVDPSESNFDAMGKGVEEGRAPEQPSNKYLSKGLTRSRTDNLVVMRGVSEPQTEARGSSNVCRRRKSWKRCNGARRDQPQPSPPSPRPNAAPKPKPRAMKARCAASA